MSVLTPVLTPLRTLSLTTQAAAGTSKCLQSFINYIQQRRGELLNDRREISEANAVEMMINLMQQRGFPKLNMKTANSLYSKLCSDTFTRDHMFDAIITWAGNKSLTYSVSDLRSYIDSVVGLSAAVKLSDPTYYTTLYAAVKDNDYQECTEAEIKRINYVLANNKLYKLKPQENKKINKTECGTCWICDTPIYQFWVYMGDGKRKELNACGEDEHTLPPGYGTYVGTLLFTPTELADFITKGNPGDESLLNLGLRPSHTFCNRAKRTLKFINSPAAAGGSLYTVNTANINECIKNMNSSMNDGILLSFELQFTTQNTRFLENTRRQVTTYMTNLCRIANNVVDEVGKTGRATPYNTAFLKAIFITCVTAVKVYPTELGKAWTNGPNKKGGKHNLIKGGQINDEGKALQNYLDSYLNDKDLTNAVISPDFCLDLDDKIPDHVFSDGELIPPVDRKIKKGIDPIEKQKKRANGTLVYRKEERKKKNYARLSERRKHQPPGETEGGTRYKRKVKRKTQRRSLHKKYKRTLKKNKRSPRKTQRRRN